MARIARFFRHDLWLIDLRRCTLWERVGYGALRVITHTVVNYSRHLVGPRAGGLTLVTLLALVPLLAIAFAVAEAFEFRGLLDQAIAKNTGDLPEQIREAIANVQGLVERTSFKALGFVGTVLLVWSAMSLFNRVEHSLNFAWRAHASRALIQRLTTFLALILVVPAFAVGSLVLSSMLSSGPLVQQMRDSVPRLMMFYDAGLWLLPHLMASVAFFVLYRLLPNARVDWRAALVAGVLAGFGLVTMHMAYVDLQVGVARANAIYATLAAVPLLLVYLQAVWTVVLLGAEVGYAIQNVNRIGPDRGLEGLTWAARERLAAGVLQRALASFEGGDGPIELSDCAATLDVPREWIDAVTEDLIGAGVAVRVGEDGFLPSRPALRISVGDVQAAVRGRVTDQFKERVALQPWVDHCLAESPAPTAFDTHFAPPTAAPS